MRDAAFGAYVRFVCESHLPAFENIVGGRHKASLINAAEHLLTCYRYIELNPVRAGMVIVPEAYRWSNYGWHGWGKTDSLISDHALYQGLAADELDRNCAYRVLFAGHLEPDAIHMMR